MAPRLFAGVATRATSVPHDGPRSRQRMARRGRCTIHRRDLGQQRGGRARASSCDERSAGWYDAQLLEAVARAAGQQMRAVAETLSPSPIPGHRWLRPDNRATLTPLTGSSRPSVPSYVAGGGARAFCALPEGFQGIPQQLCQGSGSNAANQAPIRQRFYWSIFASSRGSTIIIPPLNRSPDYARSYCTGLSFKFG